MLRTKTHQGHTFHLVVARDMASFANDAPYLWRSDAGDMHLTDREAAELGVTPMRGLLRNPFD